MCRLEGEGVILGHHARISPETLGRTSEVSVELELTDQVRATVLAFESAIASLDEVVQVRRMFGTPDYQALMAVADLGAYERFMS